MSCFLRASVLLSKEQSGTVDMAIKYSLASIFTIYINHPKGTAEADTIRMVYNIVAPLLFCRTKPQGGICLAYI